jgi:hypothetical protein
MMSQKHFARKKGMKTDLQKYLDFYNQFSIPLKVTQEPDGRKVIEMRVSDAPLLRDRFSGYENIYTDIVFDPNEKLLGHSFLMDV